MSDYREYFKQLLESTYVSSRASEEQVVKGMMTFLEKVIEFAPESLFRYRQVKDNTIDSFESGTISLCTAKCFSDKYDSMIYVDAKAARVKMAEHLAVGMLFVIKSVKRKDPLVRADKAAQLCYYLEQGMTEKEVAKRMVKEKYNDFLNVFEQRLKQWELHFRESERTARIACFTESVQSKFMWDTYADGYHGFVLEYNPRELLISCMNNSLSAAVFPVIYTDERPDLTNDAANYITIFTAHEEGWYKHLKPFMSLFDTNLLFPYKPFLYKDKEEYGHEKEWRLLYYNEDGREDYSQISDFGCLKAIYYGMDIKEDDYKRLHQIALKRGIKEYKVAIDNNSRKYSLKVIPL